MIKSNNPHLAGGQKILKIASSIELHEGVEASH